MFGRVIPTTSQLETIMNIPKHLIPILTMIEPTKDWEDMSIFSWLYHLFNNGTTIKYLPMELLNGDQTEQILRRFPEKANEEGVNWDNLSGLDWAYLLKNQPQFSVHCNWNTLDGRDWCVLLLEQPQFSVHCSNYWDKLDNYSWYCLLQEQPHLAIHKK